MSIACSFSRTFCFANSLELAMEASQVNTLPCCRCKVVKPKVCTKQKATGTSTPTQVICPECNALEGRINRMVKGLTEEQAVGYKEMNNEERKDFLKKAAGLAGPELKKILEEAIQWSIVHRRTQSMTYEGQFQAIEVVEENMKSKPDQLARLKDSAPQTTHQFTGEAMIWVPTLSMKDETEISEKQERKRTLSSEQNVKASKVAKKVQKVEKEEAPEGGPQVAVPQAQLAKLAKVAEEMETSMVKVPSLSLSLSLSFSPCPFWTQ